MGKVGKILIWFFAAISLFELYRSGRPVFGPLITGVLNDYEHQLEVVFSVAQPLVSHFEAKAGDLLHVAVHVQPAWKHFFILWWISEAASLAVLWNTRFTPVAGVLADLGGMPRIIIVVIFPIAIIISFATSLFLGAVIGRSGAVEVSAIFFGSFALLSILGSIVGSIVGAILGMTGSKAETIGPSYDSGLNLSPAFDTRSVWSVLISNFAVQLIEFVVRLVFSVIVILVIWQYLPIRYEKNTAVFAIMVTQLVVAVYLMLSGLIFARRFSEVEGSWWRALQKDVAWNYGVTVLYAVLTSIVGVATTMAATGTAA